MTNKFNKPTLSTLNTRTGSVKKYSSHASYWLDDDDEFDDPLGDKDTGEKETSVDTAIKLSAVQRAVGNFVRILTNNDKIRVKFNDGKDSYTDGKTVVIAAQEDKKEFDVMVGLALHEASHCILTDIPMVSVILNKDTRRAYLDENYTNGIPVRDMLMDVFHPDLRKYADSNFENFSQVFFTILNVIEDRRIDHYVFTRATGYRPYYTALYDKYFFSKDVDKALLNDPALFENTVEAYLNRIINITNKNASPNALRGLKQIYEKIDINNIDRLNDYTPSEAMQLFSEECAEFIEYLLKKKEKYNRHYYNNKFAGKVALAKQVNYDAMNPTWKLASEILLDVVSATGYDFVVPPEQFTPLPAMDDGDEGGDGEPLDMPGEGKFNKGKSGTALRKQRSFVNGDTRKKKISKGAERMVEQVAASGAEIVEIGGHEALREKVPVVVLHRVTEDMLKADWFAHGSTWQRQDKAIAAGIRMGQVLVNRLQIRNDVRVTHYNRQRSGRIDRRMLSQLGVDIESVFKRTRTENYRPVVLYLSLDASGSMNGDKWGKALTVATALSYLAEKVKDINVVVQIRGTSSADYRSGARDMPLVATIHDSRNQKFIVAKKLFALLNPDGATPESLCYEAVMKIMVKDTKNSDVYLINFSDGEPSFGIQASDGTNLYFGNDTATKHCQAMMRQVREYGIKVLSYFINSSYWFDTPPAGYVHPAFKASYGADASMVDVTKVTNVLRTMQRLLSSDEARSSMLS